MGSSVFDPDHPEGVAYDRWSAGPTMVPAGPLVIELSDAQLDALADKVAERFVRYYLTPPAPPSG